jgi:CheY-like chemotaxis protein
MAAPIGLQDGPSNGSGSRFSILVVDDEDAIRNLICRFLEGEGHEILLSSNASDALRFAFTSLQRFDLILTDIRMPGTSGIEFAQRLLQRWPGVPILFISGALDEEEARQQVSASGPFRFLPKPFTLSQLRQSVATALWCSPRR